MYTVLKSVDQYQIPNGLLENNALIFEIIGVLHQKQKIPNTFGYLAVCIQGAK